MHINNLSELALAIKQQRQQKGLSQTDVADLVGIKQSTVSAFELKPEATKLDTFFRILSAVGMHIELKEKQPKSLLDDCSW